MSCCCTTKYPQLFLLDTQHSLVFCRMTEPVEKVFTRLISIESQPKKIVVVVVVVIGVVVVIVHVVVVVITVVDPRNISSKFG